MTASIPSLTPRTRVRRAAHAAPELVVREVVRPVPGPPAVRPRVPTLLLAGVSHADAGALSAGLGRHPQVCLPASRRIDHFTPLRYGVDVTAPLEDYDRHFADWRGEGHLLGRLPRCFERGPRPVAPGAPPM